MAEFEIPEEARAEVMRALMRAHGEDAEEAYLASRDAISAFLTWMQENPEWTPPGWESVEAHGNLDTTVTLYGDGDSQETAPSFALYRRTTSEDS